MAYENYFVPVLEEEEQRSLLDKASKGDLEARNKVIEHNVAFVIFKVKSNPRHRKCHMSFGDFVSAGVLGLIQAIEHWDANRRTKFTTYAQHWIRHETNNAIHFGEMFRIPQSTREKVERYRKDKKGCNDGEVRQETLDAVDRFDEFSSWDCMSHASRNYLDPARVYDFYYRASMEEESRVLHEVVDEVLDDMDRCIFKMKIQGHTTKEISKAAGCHPTTVRQHLRDMIPLLAAEMRSRLRGNCEGECKDYNLQNAWSG
jgi:RNA polymerase sigma factor (sigma-70 family)